MNKKNPTETFLSSIANKTFRVRNETFQRAAAIVDNLTRAINQINDIIVNIRVYDLYVVSC